MPVSEFLPGYHLVPIAKGELGEWSKVQEELDEFDDAKQQGVRIMMAVELSDFLGALRAVLTRHAPELCFHAFQIPDPVDLTLPEALHAARTDLTEHTVGALLGALQAQLDQDIPSLTVADLKAMADVTQRAFQNGRR